MKNKIIKLFSVVLIVCSNTHLSAQVGSKAWLEKAMKEKAAKAIKPEGDMGRVFVYASANRESAITDITGVQTIYCRAYPHPKAAKKGGSATRTRYGLWKGTDCTLTGGTSCKNYDTDGGEIEASNWTKQEYVDFEFNVLEATAHEIKNGELEVMDFYVVLDGGTNNSVRMAISFPIKFDPAKSVKSFSAAAVENNKNVVRKTGVFSDSNLASQVSKLIGQRNVTDIGDINFTTSWNIEYNNANNPVRRSCKANASGKDEFGNCKFFWFTVWEEYTGGGKYQLPNTSEGINRVTSKLVPCENI